LTFAAASCEANAALPAGTSAILARTRGGDCAFFEPELGNLCAIHRELGPSALPHACRQFPRVVLRDRRGLLVSLSHFCPTAAALLRTPDDAALEIVQAPGNLTLDGEVEGLVLDTRDGLPPLLRPNMLIDFDAYDRWERLGIAMLARNDLTATQALGAIDAATSAIRHWRPGDGTLRDVVERQFAIASARKPEQDFPGHDARDTERVRLAIDAVPEGLPRPAVLDDVGAGWRALEHSHVEVHRWVRRYLAGRLFGNWVSYYGQGLHTIVEFLWIAAAVVKMEAVKHQTREASSSPWQTVSAAVRNADLLLVHLADLKNLSRRLG
jgi:hypothetical protein